MDDEDEDGEGEEGQGSGAGDDAGPPPPPPPPPPPGQPPSSAEVRATGRAGRVGAIKASKMVRDTLGAEVAQDQELGAHVFSPPPPPPLVDSCGFGFVWQAAAAAYGIRPPPPPPPIGGKRPWVS